MGRLIWIVIIVLVVLFALVVGRDYLKLVPMSVWKFLGFMIVMGVLGLGFLKLIKKLQEEHSWN